MKSKKKPNYGGARARKKTVMPGARLRDPNAPGDNDLQLVLSLFTKWRLVTYVCCVFLPPYGLYRIWSRKSNFRIGEKLVWTMMILIYLWRLAVLFLGGQAPGR